MGTCYAVGYVMDGIIIPFVFVPAFIGLIGCVTYKHGCEVWERELTPEMKQDAQFWQIRHQSWRTEQKRYQNRQHEQNYYDAHRINPSGYHSRSYS